MTAAQADNEEAFGSLPPSLAARGFALRPETDADIPFLRRLYASTGRGWRAALLVIDIALLPQWRGRGLGTALLEWVCAQAHAAGKSVTVAVEKTTAHRRCTGG